MSNTTSAARTGLLAVLLAMVGFSYSLATSFHDDVTGEVDPRAVGTNPPLAFANPFVAGPGSDRDLGDAVAGSALTRLVRAKGGLAPYTFSSTNATALATALMQLFSNGILTTVPVGGTTSPSLAPVGTTTKPFRFAVTVKDSFGTGNTVTEVFRLTFVSTTQFRFGNSKLSDAIQYRPYSDNCVVINGKAPYTFTASAVSLVSVPAATVTTLEQAGLSLSTDGVVFGAPVVSGLLTFTVVAKDATGAAAVGRSGLGSSQVYTIPITKNLTLNSVLTASSITIKANGAKDRKGLGTDSVQYKGVANLGTELISSLSGKPLSFRVGPYTGPSTAMFDARGKAQTARQVFPSILGTVRRGGMVGINIKKDTIAIPGITGGTVNLAVEVRLGDAVVGSELLTFTVKTGHTGMTLIYKGTATNDVSGAGQVTKVQGADDRAQTGDAWRVGFLAKAPTGISIAGTSTIEVFIGTAFDKLDNISAGNNSLRGARGDRKTPVITSFTLNTKTGKGTYTTGLLPTTSTTAATATGISTAGKSTGPTTFATNVTFKNSAATLYGFDSALGIFAKRSRWSSQ